jgi:hypothetical protein
MSNILNFLFAQNICEFFSYLLNFISLLHCLCNLMLVQTIYEGTWN